MRRVFMALISLVALVAISLAGTSAPANAADANDWFQKKVGAAEGWQKSGYVRRGDELDISAESVWNSWRGHDGWTVDYRNPDWWVGPDGYGWSTDGEIYQGCKITGDSYGTLLARIGGGEPFAVGNGTQHTAEYSGRLQFRINDQNRCLGDNRGAVSVNVHRTRPYDGYDDDWGPRRHSR